METVGQVNPEAKKTVSSNGLFELGWFLSGAILPIGSLMYYRRSSQKRVGIALLFFFVFTGFIALLTILALGFQMGKAVSEIRDSFDKGTFPNIVISHGTAEVSGNRPYVWEDHNTNGAFFLGVDTTGRYTSIDRSVYQQGFLLTKTHLVILDSTGRIQSFPLSEFNSMFEKDPITINADTVTRAWSIFSVILTIVIFLGLILWDGLVRLAMIAVIALVLWGIASLFRPKIGFGPFIIGGLYAVVPAVYLSHLFNRVAVSFVGLQTLLLLFFWAVALAASLVNMKYLDVESPARLWTAMIGLPLLAMLLVDAFIDTPSTAWKIALWAVALLAGIALVGVRMLFHLRDMQEEKPSNETPAGAA